jgi:hypothetical protein
MAAETEPLRDMATREKQRQYMFPYEPIQGWVGRAAVL